MICMIVPVKITCILPDRVQQILDRGARSRDHRDQEPRARIRARKIDLGNPAVSKEHAMDTKVVTIKGESMIHE